MNRRALGILLLAGGPLLAAAPHLGKLAATLANRPGDGVEAARLGAALALHEWMEPAVAPTHVVWLSGAVRGTPSLAPSPSPDGRREARFDGQVIRLVSLPDGAPVAEASLAGMPWAAAWHPSGAVLAVATAQGMEIRDGRTLKASGIRMPGVEGPALAFSPDGVWLATGSIEGGVGLWDWAAGRLVATGCPGLGRVEALAFDATGTWLRARAAAGEIVLDARRGAAWEAWWGGAVPLAAAAFAPGGSNVVTLDVQGRMEIAPWERPGKPLMSLRLASAPLALAMDSKGEWAATALGPSKARLWNLKTGLPVGAWVTLPEVSRVAVAEGGGWFWVASRSSVRAVKAIPGQVVGVVTNEPVHAFVGAPMDGWVAAVVGSASAATARVWKADEPELEVARLPVPMPGPFDMDSSGTWVVSATLPGSEPGGGLEQRRLRALDGPTGRPVIGAGEVFEEARYAAGGRWVLARQGNVLTAWDAMTGKAHGRSIARAGAGLAGVDVSADGRWVRVEGSDGAVELWALEAGERVARIEAGARRGKPVDLAGTRFAGDGGRVLVPDGWGGVRLVPLPPLAPAPPWLGNWARWVWGRTNNAAGMELDALRRAVADADPRDPWTAWGRWWMAGRGSGATSPTGGATAVEWAREWATRKDPVAAWEAWRTATGDGVTRSALARQMQTNQAWVRPYRVEQGAWLAR